MATALSAESLRIVTAMWAGRLGVSPSVFEQDRAHFRSWPGASATVVVRIGSTVVIGAPERLLAPLRVLPRSELLRPASLMAALADQRPQLLGPARLAYAEPRALTLGTASTVRIAEREDLAPVLAACAAADREESGVEEMERWWVAGGRDGEPVAAAGYEIWDEHIAHLGILVAPSHRAQGHGARAASAAIEQAVSEGMVPQWRSAVDNEPSQQLGRRLGFVSYGEQITLLQ